MKGSAHIFLGANSGEGFYSLYDQLLGERFDDLLILKGGAGCGKSSFMRMVAEEASRRKIDTIYVNCSGDPESLDGVLFPALKKGIVDGTAPHVLEPCYTGANERYVNLMRFYDLAAVKNARGELVCRADACHTAYAEAYHVLRAVAALSLERRARVYAAVDFEKLSRRFDGILRRELRGAGARRGRVDFAFLGGVTHMGELCRFDTVEALCPRVYKLSDSWGLASAQLERVCAAAAEAGCGVLACRDPDRPRELRHVLIPERGLAFVTSDARVPYPGEAYRRLRLDAMADAALTHRERAELRLSGRLERALRAEAVEALRRAKQEHDALEKAYHPYVDFDGVSAFAREEAASILN